MPVMPNEPTLTRLRGAAERNRVKDLGNDAYRRRRYNAASAEGGLDPPTSL